MTVLPLKREINIRILSDIDEIIKYLQIGVNIPIWPELYQYIICDLEKFQAKSILLLEDGNPAGHVLIFHDKKEILYFGYFGVINHEENKISRLIDEIIKVSKTHGFNKIRGPINIPGIIFGWGFMKEGSLSNLFPCNPVNPPIYQDIFLKKDFYIANIQNTWEGYLPRINPWKIKSYDFSNYDYFNPKNLKELMELKSIFLKIQSENLPPSAQITPSGVDVFNNYTKFIFDFGYNFMVFFVRYKPTQEIVACGSYIPNPFRKDDKGNYDSCLTLTWAVVHES